MKGSEKVIQTLNKILAEELTVVNQYMVHAEVCENWRYNSLAGVIKKRSIDEMKHAEKLIERILFLEGIPIVSKLNDMHIGGNVKAMLDNDHDYEREAIKSYNQGIKVAESESDNGTRDLLLNILRDEEGHIDWIESQQDQIKQFGVERYLAVEAD